MFSEAIFSYVQSCCTGPASEFWYTLIKAWSVVTEQTWTSGKDKLSKLQGRGGWKEKDWSVNYFEIHLIECASSRVCVQDQPEGSPFVLTVIEASVVSSCLTTALPSAQKRTSPDETITDRQSDGRIVARNREDKNSMSIICDPLIALFICTIFYAIMQINGTNMPTKLETLVRFWSICNKLTKKLAKNQYGSYESKRFILSGKSHEKCFNNINTLEVQYFSLDASRT